MRNRPTTIYLTRNAMFFNRAAQNFTIKKCLVNIIPNQNRMGVRTTEFHLPPHAVAALIFAENISAEA